MKRTVVMLIAGLALVAGGRQVFAHHSFSAEYDSSQKVEIQGVVTEFVWRNPHSFMKVDVADKDGTTSRLPGEAGFKDGRGTTLFPDLPGQSRDPIYNTTLPGGKE